MSFNHDFLPIFRRADCNSVTACLQNSADKWKWLGTESNGKTILKDEPLKPLHNSGLKNLKIANSDLGHNCVYQYQDDTFESADCGVSFQKICVLTYGGKGIGSTIGMYIYSAFTAVCLQFSIRSKQKST